MEEPYPNTLQLVRDVVKPLLLKPPYQRQCGCGLAAREILCAPCTLFRRLHLCRCLLSSFLDLGLRGYVGSLNPGLMRAGTT